MPHECKQELRIATLEATATGQSHDIQNLIRRLDGLIKGIWALVLVLVPVAFSLFGFLIWQVISDKLKP